MVWSWSADMPALASISSSFFFISFSRYSISSSFDLS